MSFDGTNLETPWGFHRKRDFGKLAGFRVFVCLQCGYRESIGGRLGASDGPHHCPNCGAASGFELDMNRIVWSTDPPDKPLALPGMVPEAEWEQVKGQSA